jgi:hypothetical protein
MEWYDKVVIPSDILKSKGETDYKSKVRSGYKKKKVKKGPTLSSFNTRCCNQVNNFTHNSKMYCNVCNRSIG